MLTTSHNMVLTLTAHINQCPQYVIDQSRVTIHFVANKQDWYYCATRLPEALMLGFDTETRPIRKKFQRRNPCALLQIAMRDASQKEEVFILDLLHLSPKVYNATLTTILLSKEIIKFGQSFYQDLRELAQSYPNASCFRVCKSVIEVNELSISLSGAHNPISLQKLVFFYLHRRLAKTQQTSNWARRPLTQSQLHYAAADALVLIHLSDELLLRIQKQKATKSFRLRDITTVLDVHVLQPAKCSLCLKCFETADELKTHRQICLLNLHRLTICGVCETKQLITEEDMEHHLEYCAIDKGGAFLTVKRKRSQCKGSQKNLRTIPISSSQKRHKETLELSKNDNSIGRKRSVQTKKRRKKRKGEALNISQEQLEGGDALLAKDEVCSKRGQDFKKRKMSMESSLLAYDEMWSQISSDRKLLNNTA